MTIDPNKLPRFCLVDTSIWIHALGRARDAKSLACRNFYEAMIRHERQMRMAAPTLAELVRGDLGFKVPSTPSVRVVPFDRRAAQLLGQEFPASELKRLAAESGVGVAYFKYDAMIAACALRWGESVLIADDIDHVRLARTVTRLKVKKPTDFEQDQCDIKFPHEISTVGAELIAANDDEG